MAADLVARTGRHQQRYEDGYRLVAGCIPYRYAKANDDCNGNLEQTLEVLMITSQSSPDLLFPKGGWEKDEKVEEAARREALEEAGVRGEIKVSLGFWEFKRKRHRDEYIPEGGCKAEMFALCVNEELDSWPEQNARERQWLSIEDARKQCRDDWMREALDACVDKVLRSSKPADPVTLNCTSQRSNQEQS